MKPCHFQGITQICFIWDHIHGEIHSRRFRDFHLVDFFACRSLIGTLFRVIFRDISDSIVYFAAGYIFMNAALYFFCDYCFFLSKYPAQLK